MNSGQTTPEMLAHEEARYAAAWTAMKRKGLVLILFTVLLPAVPIGSLLVAIVVPIRLEMWAVVLWAVLYVALLVVSGVRGYSYLEHPCPRCRQPFTMLMGRSMFLTEYTNSPGRHHEPRHWPTFYSAYCLHCGLARHARTPR